MQSQEQKGLYDFKKKVEGCLRENYRLSEKEILRLVKLYEDDFQEFFLDKWDPVLAATAMICSY